MSFYGFFEILQCYRSVGSMELKENIIMKLTAGGGVVVMISFINERNERIPIPRSFRLYVGEGEERKLCQKHPQREEFHVSFLRTCEFWFESKIILTLKNPYHLAIYLPNDKNMTIITA